MSNSWKKYGGTLKPDNQSTFTVKTLVADELLLRQKYSGVFEVLGSINVAQDIYGHGALQLYEGQDNTLRLDISENAMLNYDTFISKLFLGTNTIDYITGNDQNGIGVNLPNGIGSYGTFEVIGRTGISHNFVASSPNNTSSSIINRNVNDYGIRTYVTDNTSSIEFYNNDSISSALGTPNASITYTIQDGGKLVLTSPILEITDRIHETYKPFFYGNDAIKTGNALTIRSSYDASANTKLTIASSNGEGTVITGGAFPFDTSKSMGVIGVKDNVYSDDQPCMHFVTTNELYKHTFTIGVNDYNPNPNYIFNINGKTIIKNGGEINNYLTLPIDSLRVIKTDSAIYLCGYPSSYEPDSNGRFQFKIHYTTDMGANWNETFFNNSLISGHSWIDDDNAVLSMNTPFQHDTNKKLHIIATNDSYVYTTNNINNVSDWRYFNLGLFNPENNNAAYNDIVYVETFYVDNILFLIYKNAIGDSFYINCDSFYYANSTLQDRFLQSTGNITFTYNQLSSDIYGITLPSNITQSKQIGDCLFITSNNGISKIQKIGDNISISSSNTNNTYYNIDSVGNTIIAVGENIISISTDNGTTWSNISPSSIGNIGISTPILRGLHIISNSEIYIVGNGIFIYFKDTTSTNITDISYWNIITPEQMPQNGLQNIITDQNNTFIDIHKVDDENFILTRKFQEYDYDTFQNGITNFYYLNIPHLFNYETTHTLDICGNVGIDGNTNISNKLYVQNDVSLNSKLFVYDDVSINSILHVEGDANFNSNIVIDGDVSMNSKLFVADDVSLNKNINVKENAIIENTLGVHTTTITSGYVMEIQGRIYNPDGVVHQF